MKILSSYNVLLLSLMLLCKLSFSQQKSNLETQIVYQFNSYSVEHDKLLHKEFSNIADYKIVFTCIPSGIIVIECIHQITENDTESLKQKLNTINIPFAILEKNTLKDVEMKCASLRSN